MTKIHANGEQTIPGFTELSVLEERMREGRPGHTQTKDMCGIVYAGAEGKLLVQIPQLRDRVINVTLGFMYQDGNGSILEALSMETDEARPQQAFRPVVKSEPLCQTARCCQIRCRAKYVQLAWQKCSFLLV